MDKPETRLDIRDFLGLSDEFDPEDSPSGTAENQVNMVCNVYGQMSTRKGYSKCVFEAE